MQQDNKTMRILIAGFGGQGVLFLGKLIAHAGVLLGKGNADLHRAAGAYRVVVGKQLLAGGQLGNHVFEQAVELLFGFQGIDALLVAATVRRGFQHGRLDHQTRDAEAFAACFQLVPDDGVQARHDGIGLEGGFLLDDRDHRAIDRCRMRQAEALESAIEIVGPAAAIADAAGQQAVDQGFDVALTQRWGAGDDCFAGGWGWGDGWRVPRSRRRCFRWPTQIRRQPFIGTDDRRVRADAGAAGKDEGGGPAGQEKAGRLSHQPRAATASRRFRKTPAS